MSRDWSIQIAVEGLIDVRLRLIVNIRSTNKWQRVGTKLKSSRLAGNFWWKKIWWRLRWLKWLNGWLEGIRQDEYQVSLAKLHNWTCWQPKLWRKSVKSCCVLQVDQNWSKGHKWGDEVENTNDLMGGESRISLSTSSNFVNHSRWAFSRV